LLQVVAGVGKVEAFVDQREIRDDVAFAGVAENGPVEE